MVYRPFKALPKSQVSLAVIVNWYVLEHLSTLGVLIGQVHEP